MQTYENIKSGISIPLLSKEEFEIIQKPIGKAIYKTSIEKKQVGRPRKREEDKLKPLDRIKCEICGRTYVRCHKTKHIRTDHHKAYEEMNEKLRKILLDD